MLKIRLKRMGRKHSPAFRMIVIDSRKKRDGAFIERIGYYQPHFEEPRLHVDEERALHWLRQGAQPSLIVKNLFKRLGITKKFHHEKYGDKGSKETPETSTAEQTSQESSEQTTEKKEVTPTAEEKSADSSSEKEETSPTETETTTEEKSEETEEEERDAEHAHDKKDTSQE